MRVILFSFLCLMILASCFSSEKEKIKNQYNESSELLPDPEGYKKDTFIISDSLK